ncbi:MAG: Crp/Fnr family transcriptional regulator [Burkholderiales bacterium]|nr:Crp/Fnr family transcriptional regulator [Burkholderiales bacterium]MDE2300548.1 Crp/Fnr family transcriptional regulator [Burkholderiales bacterium]MDE2627702.1 Crp/Fnr family transcriptional regulator [Burkholderiales bacterium]
MATVQNLLIERLPRAQRLRLLALCEPVPLVLAEVLCEPGRPARHVYFPTEGIVSLVAPVDDKTGMEVGMVGREGVVGARLALGATTLPVQALVQCAGAAWRIDAATFRSEVGRSAELHRSLDRYVCVLMAQLATAAVCQRFHPIVARLARWLLMSQDRADADSLHVTHEFLACMLGVRRVSITTAAGALQDAGLIAYQRGALTVCDRGRLEAAACSCYATDRRAYAALMT